MDFYSLTSQTQIRISRYHQFVILVLQFLTRYTYKLFPEND